MLSDECAHEGAVRVGGPTVRTLHWLRNLKLQWFWCTCFKPHLLSVPKSRQVYFMWPASSTALFVLEFLVVLRQLLALLQTWVIVTGWAQGKRTFSSWSSGPHACVLTAGLNLLILSYAYNIISIIGHGYIMVLFYSLLCSHIKEIKIHLISKV